MSPRPGEIWLADLGMAAKTRPVVIVSRFDPDAPRSLVIYVPLTTQCRQSPYEVQIPKVGFLNAVSWANVQGIASIPEIRLERKLGVLPEGTMGEIRRALFLLWICANSYFHEPSNMVAGREMWDHHPSY